MSDYNFVFPLRKEPTITSKWGNSKNRTGHGGLDLRASIGTPILSVLDGEIIMVKLNNPAFGNAIWILHCDGKIATCYKHMNEYTGNIYSKYNVTGGYLQNRIRVNKGDIVGYSGNTGYKNGIDGERVDPHLHFEVLLSDKYKDEYESGGELHKYYSSAECDKNSPAKKGYTQYHQNFDGTEYDVIDPTPFLINVLGSETISDININSYNINNPLNSSYTSSSKVERYDDNPPFNPYNPLIPYYKPSAPPPDYYNDIFPENRLNINPYTLRIGDCEFNIPPLAINVETIASVQSIPTIRQVDSIKTGTGYSSKEISLSLWFNSIDDINGYPVKVQNGITYYMDGLRPLIAQFKRTPFLPIVNEFINGVHDIYAVTLYSIAINTIKGFPNCLEAQLVLREFLTTPYTNLPSGAYSKQICWPLFRWYYQQMLLDSAQTISKLRLLKVRTSQFTNYIRFKIIPEYILQYMPSRANQTDKIYTFIDEPYLLMSEIPLEYEKFVVNDIRIVTSNIVSNLQQPVYEIPTHQYMGSMDTNVEITIITEHRSVIADFVAILKLVQRFDREYKNKLTCGFIGIDNELLQLVGLNTFIITNMFINTVPNEANLFEIHLSLTSYNKTQKRQEKFLGLSPLENSNMMETELYDEIKKEANKNVNIDIDDIEIKSDNSTDVFNILVSKHSDTFKIPIIHDCYIEELLEGMELYPDLELMSYECVNNAIKSINNFRKSKGLELIYTDKDDSGNINSVLKKPNKNCMFVDPDFYIFYPSAFTLGLDDDSLQKNIMELVNSPIGSILDKSLVEQAKSNGKTEDLHKKYAQLHANIISYGSKYKENLITVEDIKAKKYDLSTLSEEEHYKLMCYDMFQYHKHGTLLRAFPTYMMLIVDEGYSVGGVRLWSNYYAYHSMISASVIRDMDNPIDAATIQLSNVYHTLDTMPQYIKMDYDTIDNILDVNSPLDAIPKTISTAMFEGKDSKTLGMLFPTIDERILEFRKKLYSYAAVTSGARIHLRMGYGQDIKTIPTVFNGTITSIEGSNILQITAQGDGAELVNPIFNSKSKDKTGMLGTISSEPQIALCNLLCARSNSIAFFANIDSTKNKVIDTTSWGVESKYGIEHFGKIFVENESNVIESALKALNLFFSLSGAKDNEDMLVYEVCKNIYKGGVGIGNIYSINDTEQKEDNKDTKRNLFGEKNVDMFLYGKSIWDIANFFTMAMSDYILGVHYHHFRSTLFFGMPHWLVRYAYEYIGEDTPNIDNFLDDGQENPRVQEKNYIQLVKPYMQLHMINSYLDIIDNGLIVSSENLTTCCICGYTRGVTTETLKIWADRNIAPEFQKVAYLDTTYIQGFKHDIFNQNLFFDIAYKLGASITGMNNAYENARKAGISYLENSFTHMYRGEIILLGSPALKPYDLIYLGDYFSQIFGIAKIRKVVHSMDVNMGFITSITPGLVSMSTDSQSESYAKTLGAALALGSNYDFTISTALQSNLESFYSQTSSINLAKSTQSIADVAVNTISTTFAISNVAAMVGSSLLSPPVAIGLAVGLGIAVLVKVACEFYLNNFTSLNAHTINVIPLMLKDKPMLSGCKGHKTLLVPGLGDYAFNSNQLGVASVLTADENFNDSVSGDFIRKYQTYDNQAKQKIADICSKQSGALDLFGENGTLDSKYNGDFQNYKDEELFFDEDGWSQWLEVPQICIDKNSKTYETYKGKLLSSIYRQGQFQRSSKTRTTDEGLRVYNGMYLVAVGSYYVLGNSSGTDNNGVIGTTLKIKLSDGSIHNCIVGDLKNDNDTDKSHKYDSEDFSVVEFIVDEDILKYKYTGNIAKAVPELAPPVIEIKIGKVIEPQK